MSYKKRIRNHLHNRHTVTKNLESLKKITTLTKDDPCSNENNSHLLPPSAPNQVL